VKLRPRYVAKPWGRTKLPPIFSPPAGERIGEVWFENGRNLPLLAKYIFTSERLSVQVHPNDEQARVRGLAHGKSECWYILDAEPEATIGLGFTRELTGDQLRQSAIDGSIVELMEWHATKSGDFFFVPPGTVHAIGGGISLLEFQQNSDVTYRLYDHGRPRELHLEDGIAVANAGRYDGSLKCHPAPSEELTLVDGPHFTLVRASGDALQGRLRWVIPIEGVARWGGEAAGPGECLLLEGAERLDSAGGSLLIGAPC
jgi:mannose-6-phosphate isomerase